MLNQKGSVYHEPYVSVRLPFRSAEKMPSCFEAIHPPYLPHVHQQIAFERLTGDDGRSTLIATGTGSGKTECFLYPILEYCYQHRGEHGIKALIIYPMNALATDQAKRIAELIWNSPELRSNVTAGMYVGGFESNASRMMSEDTIITDHETMLNNPPDILLTNYKMLDYLLVRPKDADLWKENRPDTLKYIAVDELHTFDGAQGTDLACLLRRLKSRLWTPIGYLCCIGTSATMGSKDNGKDILKYAEEVFGEPFEDNGRCKIHPLSSEGMEAYLSKDSYNYNYIKTKKNPELLKEIEKEIKAEEALKQQSENKKNENDVQNKQEDLKEDIKCGQNNKTTGGNKGNKSKNKKEKNKNMNKNSNSNCYLNKNRGMMSKEGNKKNNNQRKQSPGNKLASTIEKMGKVSGPVISNCDNDRGKLWEYPAPYHA